MGTQRVQAWLDCHHISLAGDDQAFMLTICHMWNDHQTARSLEVGALFLISEMRYRDMKRPGAILHRQLKRLEEAGIIAVWENGARYLDKRWYRIDIIEAGWQEHFDEQRERAKERRLQQSRAKSVREESTREIGTNLREIGTRAETTREIGTNSYEFRASTRGSKDLKRSTTSKDPCKGRPDGLRGDISGNDNDLAIDETSNPGPTPRPALVPAAALGEPETAAAVFNTLEIVETRTETREADMLNAREIEIRTALHRGHEGGQPIDEYRRYELRREIFKIAQARRKEAMSDSGNQVETVHQVPAEQAGERVSEIQQGDRRPRRQLHGVRGQEKRQGPPQEVRALQAEPEPGRLPPAWQPKRRADQAVPALSYADR